MRFFFFKLNSRCSGFINIGLCYSDQLLGYKTSFTQWKKLKCTQIHLFPFNGFIWQVYIFIALRLFLSWITYSMFTTYFTYYYRWPQVFSRNHMEQLPQKLWYFKILVLEPGSLRDAKRWKTIPFVIFFFFYFVNKCIQIVDIPIQYMFRYTNSDERCKHSAEEETISFSSLITAAAAFLRTAHVKEYQLGGRLA